jgi:hypothetical protein
MIANRQCSSVRSINNQVNGGLLENDDDESEEKK